jgi:uncharacterized protein (TIGR03435 family)
VPCFDAKGKLRLRIAASLVVVAPILSQTDKRPKFEVASIKPSPPPLNRRIIGSDIIAMPGGGLRVINKTLREVIGWAYFMDCDNRGDRISGGPDWMDSARYDIEARASQPAENLDHLTATQRRKHNDQLLRQRGQALLEDRFQLVLRRETKAGPTYALRTAKNGHKLKPGGTGQSSVKAGDERLTGENATMEDLASSLAILLGRPVVDKTGLAGGHDFKLEWTPVRDVRGANSRVGERPEMALPDVAVPSIFSPLQSQLGLKLEAVKGLVEKFVVVRAERPSEN